jgi:hypothetical protein
MIGSFVEFHARDKRVRLRLASGADLAGTVRDVADDGGWLLLEEDGGRRRYVNCGLVETFELLEG